MNNEIQKKIIEAFSPWDAKLALALLNDRSIDVNDLKYDGKDILTELIRDGFYGYAERLLERGFDIRKTDTNFSLLSLQIVNLNKKDFTLFKLFDKLMRKEDYEKENGNLSSSWVYAWQYGLATPIKFMLNKGVNINLKDINQDLAMVRYLRTFNVSDNFLNLMLSNKDNIDWNSKNCFGLSALDLLKSASFSEDWMAHQNHKILLKGLGL